MKLEKKEGMKQWERNAKNEKENEEEISRKLIRGKN